MTAPARADASRFLSVYAIVVLLLPSTYTVGSFAVTAWMTLGIVAGLIWVNGFVLGERSAVVSTPAGWGLLVLALVTVVGYIVTMVSPSLPVVVSAADRRLILILTALAPGLLALDGLTTRTALGRVQRAIVYAGGAVAFLGILQYSIGVDLTGALRLPGFGSTRSVGTIFERQGLTRVAGTTRHPIEFGVLCAVLLPLAAHVARWAPSRGQRRLGTVSALLLVVAIPMALSRAALLAVLAVIIAMFVFAPRRQREAMLLTGVALFGGFVLFAPSILESSRDLFTTDLASASTKSRLQAGDAAYERFAEAPIVGEGIGALQGLIVDNQYLVVLGEMGVMGIVGLTALFGGALLSLGACRRAGDAEFREFGGAMVAAFLGLLVGAGGLAVLSQGMLPALVTLLVGLAGAAHVVARKSAASAESPDAASITVVPSGVGVDG